MIPLKNFYPVLRRLGFRREFTYRSKFIGTWLCQYITTVAEEPHRQVIVQIWGEGEHRVTHAYHGHETTHPTNFTTVEGMIWAIAKETWRTDNKKRRTMTSCNCQDASA